MFKREVDGSEIDDVLAERAQDEIAERHPDFMEWLADDPRTVKAVGAFLAGLDVEAGLLLSLLKNEYISKRRELADPTEREEIAESLMGETI
jgi:hypothetical protein